MGLKPLVIILAVGEFSAGLRATIPHVSADHYAEIPERNVFGLKPPPQKLIETAPQRPLPKIVLTGITTILGKRALMKTQPVAGKPGEQTKELSLILAEGQRDGDIEVLQIDEKAGSVKVNNSGTVMTLTFERDGSKLPATPPPPPPAAGIPTVAGVPVPLTNHAIVNAAFTNPAGLRPLPTRNFRLPAAQPANGQAAGFQPPVGGIAAPTGVVPVPAPASQPSDLTPEEQSILQQVEREVASPLPPVVSNAPAPGSAAVGSPLLPQ